jgi:hypothetical protein
VRGKTLFAGDGKDNSGIHAAREKDDCVFHGAVIRDSGLVIRKNVICSSFPRRRESSDFRSNRCNLPEKQRAIPAFAGMTNKTITLFPIPDSRFPIPDSRFP